MRARSFALLAAALGLAACSGNSLGLRGAGSMLVEVELYKGPLGQSEAIQIGELQSVLEETARAMREWVAAAKLYHGSRCVFGDRASLQPDCIALNEVIETGHEVVDDICSLSPDLAIYDYQYFDPMPKQAFRNTCEGMARVERAAPTSLTGQKTGSATEVGALPTLADIGAKRAELARRISAIAGNMKSKGFRIADGLISYVPADRSIRAFIINFDLITAEYANQIQARIGVLDKQLAGRTRTSLPVGQYLRDASPTDFIHLFDWFGAAYGDQALAAPGQLGVADRVRMAERLFADYYWEKINEVYTSGQGDVNMAFIKDDIGNWDLKSFSNDPAKLVSAYRDAANAAISAIADAASGGTTKGVKTGEQLLDLGNRLATGESRLAPNLGVLDASALHGRALEKLSARRSDYGQREKDLLATKATAENEIATAEKTATSTDAEVTSRQSAVTDAERKLADCQHQSPPDTQTPPCASQSGTLETAQADLAKAQSAKAAADSSLAQKRLADRNAAADLTALRKAAQKDIRDILDDHLALIAMLQEAVAGQTQATARGGLSCPRSPRPLDPCDPAHAADLGSTDPLTSSIREPVAGRTRHRAPRGRRHRLNSSGIRGAGRLEFRAEARVLSRGRFSWHIPAWEDSLGQLERQAMTEDTAAPYGAEKLTTFAAELFCAAGLEQEKARTVAEILVEGDLLGHTTHGLALAAPYLEAALAGSMRPEGEPAVISDRGGALCWDGRRLPGPWLVTKAIDGALARVAKHGIVAVAIRESHHIACLASYLERATASGCMILLTCSDPSEASVAPFGGLQAVFTPDPIAFGIPTGGDPILIDMSASITTNAMTARLRTAGRRFPGPWAMSAGGEASDDPNVLAAQPPGTLLPTGGKDHGHKGYSLALAVEALSQGLSGHGRADPLTDWGASVYLQVMDPGAFGGAADFVRQTGFIAEACRRNPPAPGVQAVRVPGELSLARKRQALREGVRLYPGIMEGLRPLATRLGVALPSPQA